MEQPVADLIAVLIALAFAIFAISSIKIALYVPPVPALGLLDSPVIEPVPFHSGFDIRI